MKNKRNYLLTPGHLIKVRIEGGTLIDNGYLASKIKSMVQADGLFATSHDSSGLSELVITCPTEREARDLYLEGLSGHESATLQGHLKALGYEL